MNTKNTFKTTLKSTIFSFGPVSACLATAGVLLLAAQPARALNLYDGITQDNNLEINLTTTLSYTGAVRVNNPSTLLKTAEDGDANFQHGIVANLISAVPVLDIRDGNFGAHFSAQFYLNTPYLGTNQNNLRPYSSALYTAKQTDFASATRNVEGENAQLLDAFVFGQHRFADGQTLQVKVGRSTLFWGQSLFFPADGISGGQAPIDLITAQNLINPQAQQVFMPVGQSIVTYQPMPGTTVQAYYQFQWEPYFFQGEGAYFNGSNILDRGASYLTFANTGHVTIGVARTDTINPPGQNGQFGLSFQQQLAGWDLGIYGERYDAKIPEMGIQELHPPRPIDDAVASALSVGTYTAMYPRDIWLQGVSFSTNLGPANVAGELSAREHQPLVTNVHSIFFFWSPGAGQNANGNPGYPVGNTWDAQLSTIYLSPVLPFDPGGISFAGEIIMQHLISVTSNRNVLRTDGQATAGALDLSITPTYNNVLPNLQVTFPVGLLYDYLGRSEIDTQIMHGNAVFSMGVTGTYKSSWIASLAYKDYIGRPDVVYNQLADRGFVSLNLQHTF